MCFELLVVNNWFVTCDGFVAVTGTVWTRLYVGHRLSHDIYHLPPTAHITHRLCSIRRYFYAFYIVGVSIILNVAVAFIMDQ